MPATPDPVRAALYQHLAEDEALAGLLTTPAAIFEEVAAPGTEPPYVVFNFQGGTDQWTFQGGSNERALWLVKGVCRGGSATPAEAIDARCLELLHSARLPLPNGRALHILHEAPVRYGETVSGEQWRHRGGIYRLFT